MKKNISILVCLLIAWIVNGQSNNVGINTDNPQRKLHVEGNLRVRNLKEKGGDSQYNRILVTMNNTMFMQVDGGFVIGSLISPVKYLIDKIKNWIYKTQSV